MSSLNEKLNRCDREVSELELQAKNDSETKAFLATLGQEDWKMEKRLILEEEERLS